MNVAALRIVEHLQRALQQDDRAAIIDAVRLLAAAGAGANMGEQWHTLARIAAENGEIGLARQTLDLYVASFPGNAAAQFNKAGLLAQMGAWEEAQAAFSALPADLPDPAGNALGRGTAALYLGQGDEARRQLERATRANPQSGPGWLSVATLVDFAKEPELAARLIAQRDAMAHAAAPDRGTYFYALGKVHADRGDHSEAFAAFALGARDMKVLGGYSRERDQRVASEAVAGYTSANIAQLAALQSEPSARTIFVMGLPRSGTTLVEQILTSHSGVSDGGEVNRLGLLVKDLQGMSHEALSAHVARVGVPALGQLWGHWVDERFPGTGRIIDKTTNSSRMLGLAASLLPDAPLIWMKRDPLDCAWSCFRTCFMHSLPWTYDLEDIAFHLRLEDQLLVRWQELLGARLLVVPFEEMVSEPEPWIRKILVHCGLEEQPQVFAPHENPRAVGTSSVMQVRRPINRAGIGVAEPYRAFLQPFIDAYYG